MGNGHLTDVKLTVIVAGTEALALLHSLGGSLARLAVTQAASRHELLLSLGAGAGSSSPDPPPKALPRTSGGPPLRPVLCSASFTVLLGITAHGREAELSREDPPGLGISR